MEQNYESNLSTSCYAYGEIDITMAFSHCYRGLLSFEFDLYSNIDVFENREVKTT